MENETENSRNKFVHLHLHTEYSMLDGAVRLEDIFRRCDELGMPAVAITDHGNMYGALHFVKEAVKYTDKSADVYKFLAEGRQFKVKPIIGCEVYMTEDMRRKNYARGEETKNNHLVLLAKDDKGYHNLIKLVSLGFTEGFYRKPRIDFELLSKYSEGLVCLSACIAGVIPQCLLKGDYKGADQWVKKFKALFGEDFYIEIQDHNIKKQKIVLPMLISLARENGVKIVATNDVHYLNRKDAHMQKVLQCIAFVKTITPEDEDAEPQYQISSEEIDDDSYFPTKEFYLKSYDEMRALFPDLDEAFTSTLEIADKCECNFFVKKPLLPAYVPSDGSTPYEFLRALTFKGLKEKFGDYDDNVLKRAEYELDTINKLGFVEYFLIVWDFIHYSETHGVPVGPGRGSGVGSIVAYAIGITKVNPLKYTLIFERFLNAERVSNPDFDIDFCVEGREKIIEYVISKYGEKNVSQIITFGTLAAKAAVKDVARVYGLSFNDSNRITKLMPSMMGYNKIGHLLGLLPPTKDDKGNEIHAEIPELIELYRNDITVKRILDMAMKIEGMPRQTGMHAAGVIICCDEISNHIPMALSTDGLVTTQFDKKECEELGLLKMDFLGLRTLTDIDKTLKLIKQTRGLDIDLYKMEYDDPEVFNLISSGDTHAVFQLESEGMKNFMRNLKPSSLEDIIAGISLFRPGPMDKIDDYVRNKRDPSKITYDTPLLKDILDVTYGVMVYQEQVMQIVRTLAGYSLGRADIVRRIMAKKDQKKMMEEAAVFINGTPDGSIPGCLKNGVSEEAAKKVFDDMRTFASYAFNKSHAAAYAYLAYQTAYLKRYFTVEFITAVLNNRITDIKEITNYLTYLKKKGIKVLPPNVNKSVSVFSVEDGGVRIGLSAIKNVGSSVIEELVNERNRGGEFKDFYEFVERMSDIGLNKKMLENLIFAGAFDCFGNTRNQLIKHYDSVIDRVTKDKKSKSSGQMSFFDFTPDVADKFEMPPEKEFPRDVRLAYEKEVSGVYLTGHPLEDYVSIFDNFEQNTSVLSVDDTPEDTKVTLGGLITKAERRFTKSGKEFGSGILEDLYGSVEIILLGNTYHRYKDVFAADKLVTVRGKTSVRGESVGVRVDSMEEWKGVKKEKPPKKMCIFIKGALGEYTLEKICAIAGNFEGKDSLYIKRVDSGERFLLPVKIFACEALRAELYGVGDEIDTVGIYD